MSGVIGELRKHLEIELAFGVADFAVAPKAHKSVESVSKRTALDALNQEYSNCQLCPLSTTRKTVVFGSGNPDAALLFVGEAPGFDEDVQGQPFVGLAGQLLTKIIEAMKLKREDVYIANILKCRPPNNRNPLPSEIAACRSILDKQIAIIQPKVICALGKFAAQTLLGTEQPITKLRGKFVDWQGFALMPTFHPAYLLRNPSDKKLVWEDMQQVMKALGIA